MDGIVWLGRYIDNAVFGYVMGRIALLCAWLGPILASVIMIWGTGVFRATATGQVPHAIGTFSWDAFQKACVVAVATITGVFNYVVSDFIESLAGGAMLTFFTAPGNAMQNNAGDVWAAIQGVDVRSWDLVVIVARDFAVGLDMLIGLAAVVMMSIGVAALELVAIGVTVQAKVFRLFVLMLGPIAIGLTLIKQTTGLFFSWLHMLLSMVVLTWVTYFCLGVALFAATNFVDSAKAGLDADNVLKIAGGFVVLMLSLAAVLWNAPNLATGITGGTPMQLGSQLVMQAAQTYLQMQKPKGGDGAGNSLGKATPAATVGYAAGHAMASAGRWAYQSIASRGRSNP
ncbi:type IV secretion system protein [Azohydromonas australica]|uniref:type IV secretion system protein n=1 Tax=Azohydromonas australica TaxID=364039 RepID=UPI000423EE6D|nr:type IV secretion system protein [Azohydromonas australica]